MEYFQRLFNLTLLPTCFSNFIWKVNEHSYRKKQQQHIRTQLQPEQIKNVK